MPISIAGYLLSRVLAEREGVADSAALNRLALVGALLPNPLLSLLITRELAIREVAAGAAPEATTFALPDVTRQSVEAAQQELARSGLHPFVTTVPKNAVVEQSPAAGTMVKAGDSVSLTISLGVEVPNITAQPYADVGTTLKTARLVAARQDEFSDTVERGVVIKQDPVAGAVVAEGSTVIVTVSKGPSTTTTQVAKATQVQGT